MKLKMNEKMVMWVMMVGWIVNGEM
jgi:hypothetical protein